MDIVKQYEELLKLDPGSIAFAPLAEELCYRGFWEGAVKVCRQGLTHHPQHLRGRVLLGWALKELGESDEAEKVLVEVEGEVQKNALLFRLLAELAKKAGHSDRAERLLLIHRNLQPGTLERTAPLAVEVEAPPPAVSPQSLGREPTGTSCSESRSTSDRTCASDFSRASLGTCSSRADRSSRGESQRRSCRFSVFPAQPL